MEIKNPRRMLVVGASNAGVLDLIKDLTGSAPSPIDSSTAGLSHTLSLKTPYYTAAIPIWIDELASLPAWTAEFLAPEACAVVSALGAWIFCFRRPLPGANVGSPEHIDTVKDSMRAVQAVIKEACGDEWDGVCLAVAMPQTTVPYVEMETDEWEYTCREFGFEYVDSEAKEKNEFGEKTGVERVKEALEANEWDGDDLLDSDFEQEGDGEEGLDGEEAEMGVELFGMKGALRGNEGESEEAKQVEDLERMMGKLQTVKGTLLIY
ncbi:hypothetical protein EJ05DRAFT_7625 [Pseudovirgaria hyperparasitica]|uniref:Uncharacterized protein n=1 Tax=Pseudovirgaria hyperparasitica TaxID=470096 RepID=A0A6A6WKD8_9PEZI|nr:uncharacterized protein EJ05DRAFT_7625 [Pseudovirgaria hyperparasitica]KAF2762613.1 hypothetical protein EJ05DRAFT_7625 [Pseudovirgaria hyperparasitica]